ncbi:SHNi-TPR-domain-containing protein [Dipodascopsis tothii]|uniref:SHNi-TPR-domain-containing protein n=1 Tax=Dipodascopsis tothii TaxID=44089 RepID=UPI0034CD3958
MADASQAQVDKHVAAGGKAYGLKNYGDAAEQYALACEQYVAINSKDDPDLLFLYGRALFQVAVQQSEVLGGAPQREDEAALENLAKKTKAAAESSTSADARFQFSGDAEDSGSESDDEAGGEEDNDFETAWEVLDLARTLFEKRVTDETGDAAAATNAQLAEVYDILGEVSLESENFEQAAQDLRRALEIKQGLHAESSALVTEAHYKLSLALEFVVADDDRKAKAAAEMEAAIAGVRARLDADGADADGAEILKDLETRLADLRAPDAAPAAEPDELTRQVAAAIAGANDLSGLVRKRKPESRDAGAAAKKQA